jgi:hypothetical protein
MHIAHPKEPNIAITVFDIKKIHEMKVPEITKVSS